MTDRELLELAAKAGGVELVGWREHAMTDGGFGAMLTRGGIGHRTWWNPLTDDGEALRLAAYLCMTIRHEDPAAVIAGWSAVERVPFTRDGRGPWHWKEWLRDHQQNRAAATRHAIVRAAAEIGKTVSASGQIPSEGTAAK